MRALEEAVTSQILRWLIHSTSLSNPQSRPKEMIIQNKLLLILLTKLILDKEN